MSNLREIADPFDVAAPTGTATSTRLRLTDHEFAVIEQLTSHLSGLRRRDLLLRCRQGATPDKESRARRKRDLTAESSSRWAGSITRGNDAQYALARRGQVAHTKQLKAAIKAIETRLAIGVGVKVPGKGRRKAKSGYKDQFEQHAKQQRLQHLKAKLASTQADINSGTVHVVDGGKAMARKRHNLADANLTEQQWREQWTRNRAWVRANGSSDESYGNLTIMLTPAGQLSIRLPKPLEHLANSPRGRFTLSQPVAFKHRGAEWAENISGGGAVSYTLSHLDGRKGWWLTASWTTVTTPLPSGLGRTIGVDLNADHLAGWVLDRTGNPIGRPITIPLVLTGSTGKRDAILRQATTRLVNTCLRRGVDTICIEDLGFDDARDTGRETMGRGNRGKRFRRTVSGIPTAKFRQRLSAMAARAGVALVAVDPAYTSKWGAQHWLAPLKARHKDVTRHHAAGVAIGRRGLGHGVRRRKGVTAGNQTDCRAEGYQPDRTTIPAPTRGSRPPNGTAPDPESLVAVREEVAVRRATVTPAIGHTDRHWL